MLLGHDDKIRIFEKLIRNGSLSQAYLFFGLPQIGKFYFAKLIASALEWGSFELSEEKTLIDAQFFSSSESIGIETIREIKKFLSQKPFKSPRRLVVLDNADNLTREAESALLKIVEEPPSQGMIIFIARDRRALFEPLLSRLTSVYFSSLPQKRIEEFLVKEKKLGIREAGAIASASFGRIGRAYELSQNKKRKAKDGELLPFLQDKIVDLYLLGVLKNYRILSRLLRRELVLNRFNLNANLQQKAIEYELKS